MTITTTTSTRSFSGDASTTVFAYNYKILDDDEIQVIIRAATGAETVKEKGTHYTVSGVGVASGGNITFGSAPANTETVVLRRSTPQTQSVDLVENDPFTAETVEGAFDRSVILAQELQEQVNRSIKISRTNTMTSTEFTNNATSRANKILSFDASGELSIAQELGTFKGDSATTTTAAFNVRDIVKGTTTAQLNNIYICVGASAIGDVLTDTDHWALIVDAVSAAASATTATTKASAAASSASAASASETAAETAETNAETAEAAAVVAKNAAVTAQNAAVAALDSFDDVYLGSKSSAPSVDNDGDALATGALYFNSSNNTLFYWTGSAWNSATPTTLDSLTDTNLTSVADGAMLLYDTGTSKWIDNIMSGDATMADTGAITIGNDKIDSQHYVAASIDNEHLADNAVGTDEIADDAVTYAKIQNVSATDRILGRDSASAGVIEEITPANLRTMINVADGSNAYVHPNHTGEVTSTTDGATVIADNIVDEANLKVSNTPTNGYMLTAQSGNTGGLTWAEAGGGATTLITTVTTSSNGGTIEIATAGYNSYILDIGNWRHTGGGTEKLHCTLKRSGESSYDSSYGYGVINLQTAAVLIDTTGAANIVLNGGIRKGDSGSTRLALNNFGTDALVSSVFGQTVQSTNGHAASHTDTVQVFSAGGAIDDADSGDVITHILLGLSGDEFPAGIVYRLYGIT